MAVSDDPRLRKLFALVGIALDQEEIVEVEDEMMDLMLDIAPEFMPPDDTDDEALYDEWWAWVENARHNA